MTRCGVCAGLQAEDKDLAKKEPDLAAGDPGSVASAIVQPIGGEGGTENKQDTSDGDDVIYMARRKKFSSDGHEVRLRADLPALATLSATLSATLRSCA